MANQFDTMGSLQLEDYATPEEKIRDRHFQEYKDRKYQGTNPLGSFEYTPPKAVSSEDVDKNQFQRAQEDFTKRNELYHDIKGVANWGMAWDTNNARDAELKDYGALSRGEMSLEEVRQRNDERMNKIANERGLTREDLDKWSQKKQKGFIWGLSDTANDLRDAATKSGLLTLGFTAAGAAGGAIVGLAAGGVGAAVGAKYGAELGFGASKAVALAGGIFWDTSEKEAASSFKAFMDARPDASAEDFERARHEAAMNGMIDGVLESGTAVIFAAKGLQIASRIPGVKKVFPRLTAKDEVAAVKSLKSAFSGEAGKAFVADMAVNMGIEMSQEEAQTLLDHVSEYRMGILEKEDVTAKALAVEAFDTAHVVFQKTFLLAGLGAGANVRSRVAATAETLNKKVELNNAEYETEEQTTQETRVLTGGIEKTEIVSMPEETLDQVETESGTQVKQIVAQEAVLQTQIDNAEGLGLGEQEVSTLEKQLQELQGEKEEATAALKSISAEKARRTAEKVLDQEIQDTSVKLEKKNEQLESTEDATKITKIEKEITKLEGDYSQLVAKKEGLLGEETSEKIMGEATVMSEKRSEKTQVKLNKALEKNAKDKVNAAIKNIKDKNEALVSGYLTGSKEQIKETKDVNTVLTKALLGAGVKRSEIGAFDGIKSKIVTLSDLVANKKSIGNKIGDVFEKRNKELALKTTDRLRKLARPFKGGKSPKGKMTPEVQNKVDRMFLFAEKSAFEAGFDIEELSKNFLENPDAELSTSNLAASVIAQNNATILANTEEINTLEDTKQTPKTKWEGLNKDREGLVEGSSGSIQENVKELKIEEPKEPGDHVATIKDKAYKAIANSLNLINMGFSFKNLTVDMKSSLFDKDNTQEGYGVYDRSNKSLRVNKSGEFTIPHEVGHYFDNTLGEMLSGEESSDFSTLKNFDDPALKKIVAKMSTLMKAEANRVRAVKGFNSLEKSQKEYLTSAPETFARIFNAIYNKETRYKNLEIDLMSELTRTVPTKTMSAFKSILNDLAQYKETGSRIFELQTQNEELAEENANIRIASEEADKAAREKNMPTEVAELVHELEISSELKGRTSSEIRKFNEYIAELIQTGRDVRAEKLEQKRVQREKNIEELNNRVKTFAPKDAKSLGGKLIRGYTHILANWNSYLNALFGQEMSAKYSVRKETLDREKYVFREQVKLNNKLLEVGEFRSTYDLAKYIQEGLKEESTYLETVKGEQIPIKLNRMDALNAYIASKNPQSLDILQNKFGKKGLNSLLNKLDDRDRKLGDTLQEITGSEEAYNTKNEVYKRIYDMDMPREEAYFPRKVETLFR